MSANGPARQIVSHEARALLARLRRVGPFLRDIPMVPAAAPSPEVMHAIDAHLAHGRSELQHMVRAFCAWLDGPDGRASSAARIQARFTFLRIRFNAVLADFDVFADALSQRSDHRLGVRLAGIDALARDALKLPEGDRPGVVCYLDGGFGAAIRRARTRLPAGGANPVAVVRVPRERMVGTGIGSSVVHEVGHQVAAMLGWVESLKPMLRAVQQGAGPLGETWESWHRWISEIVPDLWAVSRLGIAAPYGLMAVVSLPRVFVFRPNEDDPHPMPWVRVLVSCAFGEALYPDACWAQFFNAWKQLYPTTGLDTWTSRKLFALRRTVPSLVKLVLGHRPPSLLGRTLGDWCFDISRSPARLRSTPTTLETLGRLEPTVALAVLGQARADGALPPEEEASVVGELLETWALSRAAGVRPKPVAAFGVARPALG